MLRRVTIDRLARLASLPLLATLTVTLSACDGDTSSTEPPPSPVSTSSRATAPQGSDPVVVATAKPGAPGGGNGDTLEVGGTATLDPLTLTVSRVETRSVAGGARAGAELHACVAAGYDAPAAFTVGAWTLLTAAGDVPAVGDGWDTSMPIDTEAPLQGELVEPGDCLDSWVTFDVDPDVAIDGVRYSNRQHDTVAWRVTAP